MNLNYDDAYWGIFFAGLFYVVGNAAWVNQWARNSRFVATVLWAVLGLGLLMLAAFFDMRLDPSLEASIWDRMSSVDGENHWIALTLYALLSTPAIASNLFALDLRMTKLALIVPALFVFIPIGKQLEHPQGSLLLISVGAAAAVIAIVLLFEILLDAEPKKKTRREKAAA